MSRSYTRATSNPLIAKQSRSKPAKAGLAVMLLLKRPVCTHKSNMGAIMFYELDDQISNCRIPPEIQRQLPKMSHRLRLESTADFLHYMIVDHYYENILVSYEYINARNLVWC